MRPAEGRYHNHHVTSPSLASAASTEYPVRLALVAYLASGIYLCRRRRRALIRVYREGAFLYARKVAYSTDSELQTGFMPSLRRWAPCSTPLPFLRREWRACHSRHGASACCTEGNGGRWMLMARFGMEVCTGRGKGAWDLVSLQPPTLQPYSLPFQHTT